MNTYPELLEAFRRWIKREDLDGLFPDFVTLAEARIYRGLRISALESGFTGTISAYTLPKPSDWITFKSLWSTAEPSQPITARPLEYLIANENEVHPRHFAAEKNTFRFDCAGGSVRGTYYAKAPGLTDIAPTNALLTAAPDLYLFATLGEAHLYAMDDQQAGFWNGRTEVLIAQLNADDMANRYGGQLGL